MKKTLLIYLNIFLVNYTLFSQTTETFETENTDATNFNDNNQSFTIVNGVGETAYDIEFFVTGGYNGVSNDDKFIDNSGGGANQNDGSSFSLITTNGAGITIKNFYLFVATKTITPGVSTTLTFIGKKNGLIVYTVTKSTGIVDGANFTPNNGFTYINLAIEGGVNNSNTEVDELIISSTNNGDYMALDAFTWGEVSITAISENLNNNLKKVYYFNNEIIVESLVPDSENFSFELFNISGQKVLSKELVSHNITFMSIENLDAGSYFLKLVKRNKTFYTKKFIK